MLDSLVAFAEIGDDVAIAPAGSDLLTLSGPFADAIAPDGDNILVKALDLARRAGDAVGCAIGPLAIHLEKRLPVASGIGGGSADAAALLRRLAAAHPELRAPLSATSLSLGADVPMCLADRPCRVGGIGEAIEPLAAFPAMAIVLVNPGTPVSTPAVFRALERRDNAPLPELPQGGFRTASALLAWLAQTRNDLEAPALAIAPAIGAARAALIREGASFARMSGSGATVFGLFEGADLAARAAAALGAEHPAWWVAPSRLRPAGSPDAVVAGKARPTSELDPGYRP